MTNYLVVGLGRFGRSVAKTLYEHKQYVLGIDSNEDLVQQVIDEQIVDEGVVLDVSEELSLTKLVKDNFDTAFICIGANMEASILTTLLLKEIGIKKIICKAKSRQQGKVLQKIGATEIIYPEEFMGKRTALKIMRPTITEHFKFSDDYSIIEIKAPHSFDNKNLIELRLRDKYEANVIGIKQKDGTLIITPKAENVIYEGDILIIITDTKKIDILNKIL